MSIIEYLIVTALALVAAALVAIMANGVIDSSFGVAIATIEQAGNR